MTFFLSSVMCSHGEPIEPTTCSVHVNRLADNQWCFIIRLFTRGEADELYAPIYGLECFAWCRLYLGGIGIGGYIEGAKRSLARNLWWTFPGGGQIQAPQVLFPILYLIKTHTYSSLRLRFFSFSFSLSFEVLKTLRS